jgi:hypothetical protein
VATDGTPRDMADLPGDQVSIDESNGNRVHGFLFSVCTRFGAPSWWWARSRLLPRRGRYQWAPRHLRCDVDVLSCDALGCPAAVRVPSAARRSLGTASSPGAETFDRCSHRKQDGIRLMQEAAEGMVAMLRCVIVQDLLGKGLPPLETEPLKQPQSRSPALPRRAGR